MTTNLAAHQALTGHRLYHYRGCAPDPELPAMAAGDPDVSLDAWLPYTGDGAEPQRQRLAREQAALTICARCPVQTACATYAMSVTADGKLAEPEGIWGGMRALDRHRRLITSRTTNATAGPSQKALADARTPQKRAVLAALARDTDEELVAFRAGMDVRTANWHRSTLCTLLGLDKETATREQLLTTATAHGLLPKGVRVVPDGAWPTAAAPTTDGARQRRIARGAPRQLLLPPFEGITLPRTTARPAGGRRQTAPRRTAAAVSRSSRGGGRARLRLVAYTAEPLPLTDPTPVLKAAA